MTLQADAALHDAGPGPLAALTPRVHAAVLAGRGDHAPATMTIPNAHYTDPAIAARELATSFEAPLLVGPSSMVRNRGDYVSMTLVDKPIIVVRSHDED